MYHFELLLRDSRLTRRTIALFSKYNAPGISEIKRSMFTVQLLVYFSKMVTNKSKYNAVNSFKKRKDVICNRIKFGRSKLILLEFIKNTYSVQNTLLT